MLGQAAGFSHTAWSQPAPRDPWTTCAQAAAAAEQAAGVPAGLLLAIGKVESGRVDPATGRVAPWPYALNIEGRGLYPDSADAAMAEVSAAQAAGARSIDVGCFQISLLHHPNAFATLGDAFEPAHNANYAARFLTELRGRMPSWELAAGGYHSLTPLFAEPYAARVMSAWAGADPAMPFGQPMLILGGAVRSAAAHTVRVFLPGAGAGAAWSSGRLLPRMRLPVVYRPASQ